MTARATHQTAVTRVHANGATAQEMDLLAAEEPLEIRVDGRPAAITMRTPGHDLDLVAGFLYTEGVIDGPDDLTALAHVDDPSAPRGNTVDTVMAAGVPAARRRAADRAMYASSSCGVCGKESIDRLMLVHPKLTHHLDPDPRLLTELPARLREEQSVFHQTGGLHAAALVTLDGTLEIVREDIGRHNAVDKVIGWRLRADQVPIHDRILLVSGRVGFEIVQKALVAQIAVVAAVGAPSSLAVQLAQSSGMQLIGFLRDGRYNRYSD
jgi:FdhD protein